MLVAVAAWIKIGDTSRIEYSVFRDGVVEFFIGEHDDLALVTTVRGLQHFMVHADEALRAVQSAVTGTDER